MGSLLCMAAPAMQVSSTFWLQLPQIMSGRAALSMSQLADMHNSAKWECIGYDAELLACTSATSLPEF